MGPWAGSAIAEEPGPVERLIEADPDVQAITLLPGIGSGDARTIPVGAFCPARPANPISEASTFGLTALLMWSLARRRLGAPKS